MYGYYMWTVNTEIRFAEKFTGDPKNYFREFFSKEQGSFHFNVLQMFLLNTDVPKNPRFCQKNHIDFSKKQIKNYDLRPYSSLICMTPHRRGTSNVENCIASREIWACQFPILLSALSTMHTKCDIGSSIFSGVCEMRFLSELYFANYWANYNLMNHNDLMSL